MIHAQPIITTSRVEAYIASALRVLSWLFGAILNLKLTGRSARLRHALARAERTVERILFLKAVALYGPLPRRPRNPRAAPSGFRRVVRSSASFFRSAKVRARKANAITRVLALIEALTNPERTVAYFLKCITRGLRLAGLVAIAPAAAALTHSAARAGCGFCDSS